MQLENVGRFFIIQKHAGLFTCWYSTPYQPGELMRRRVSSTNSRPKCQAHYESFYYCYFLFLNSLVGRARLGIPKLGTRLVADVQAVRANGPPHWRPKQSHLAQRSGREREKTPRHSCTSHTEHHQALREFQVLCSPAVHTHKTAQHETSRCARCSCLSRAMSSTSPPSTVCHCARW